MSLTGRPRIVVNGVRRTRTFHYFWCLYCQRTVRIGFGNNNNNYNNNNTCPYCFQQLRHELDISRPRLVMNVPNNMELIHNLALIIDPPLRRQNNTIPHWETENEDEAWITLGFPNPDNNRTGPPPATSSAIAALPLVNLTQAHLATDPHCPICKDEFEIDMEVIELPCKHFYHSHCIIPWLHMHNTCPVCRYELQGSNNATNYPFQNHDITFGPQEPSTTFIWIWNQLASFAPIRFLLHWTRSYFNFQQDHLPAPTGGSWWRELFVL